MCGLVGSTGGLLLLGDAHGVVFPPCAWLVPGGAVIFAGSIAIDTIGHRTIYKAVLAEGEALVHHIIIALGIGSCILLCAAWKQEIFAIPAMVLTVLSFVYSLIDEVFHWKRYMEHDADRVEMWSHVSIMVGHGIMMLGWWQFYYMGYPGIDATVALLP